MQSRQTTDVVLQALLMAVWRRKPQGEVLIHSDQGYRSRDEARQDVFDYIEMFYNPKRKHVRNGMMSPVEFERLQKT